MAYRQRNTEERYKIAAMRAQGFGRRAIAAALRRHPSIVYRDLKRNATPYDGAYRPSVAVEKTNGRRRRSRRHARYGALEFARVAALLRKDWSPAQIVGRCRREGRPVMSHETIYRRICGLLRQYFPKGADLRHLTQYDCGRIAAKLNHRPHRCLGFRTSHEFYYRSVLAPRH
jgi:IS30 family transposase